MKIQDILKDYVDNKITLEELMKELEAADKTEPDNYYFNPNWAIERLEASLRRIEKL